MKHAVNPTQKGLFDPEMTKFSPVAYRVLSTGWQGVFRKSLLERMPTEEMGKAFSETMGRPTKELYSMAGLVVVAQMKGWTSEEAAQAYMFDLSVQYALNLGHHAVEVTSRTVERYQRLFREKDLAQRVFDEVARTLVRNLEIEVDQQRLDSTHVYSNMASLSRTQLMLACIRRFLVQLKRRHNAEYAQVRAELRTRCEAKDSQVFGGCEKNETARRQLRQQVAKDMLELVEQFASHKQIPSMPSYQALARCLHEQCDVAEGKVDVRKKTSGRALQNPSDPDATLDGHKGKGYQAQIAETYNPRNAVQLITAVIPETAADEDGDALQKVVGQLTEHGLKPTTVLADGHYGSDENEQACESAGIRLVAPVRGKPPGPGYVAKTEAQKRLEKRRAEQTNPEWKKSYNPRAGIEGTNSGLKRRLGFGRLRVRGKRSVFCVLLLKAAGWNILRASAALAQQARKPRKQGNRPRQGPLGLIRFAFRTLFAALADPSPAWPRLIILPARLPETA